jgi:hypothetical protein
MFNAHWAQVLALAEPGNFHWTEDLGDTLVVKEPIGVQCSDLYMISHSRMFLNPTIAGVDVNTRGLEHHASRVAIL